jgi:4-hydroxyphenylpyruvate dioxygenase
VLVVVVEWRGVGCIQRKKHNGFGEGNFQALFDSIELDQIRRGYLK